MVTEAASRPEKQKLVGCGKSRVSTVQQSYPPWPDGSLYLGLLSVDLIDQDIRGLILKFRGFLRGNGKNLNLV